MLGRMRSSYLVGSLAVVAVAASCGGGAPAAEDPSSAAGESEAGEKAAPAAEEEVAWADMDHDQRLEYMGTVVLPTMEKLFKAYDAEGFSDFGCKTCHGEDGEAVNYKLPNGLYALPPADPVAAAKEYDAEVTAFMQDKVNPEMAKLLGTEVGNGFSCMTCHEAE